MSEATPEPEAAEEAAEAPEEQPDESTVALEEGQAAEAPEAD